MTISKIFGKIQWTYGKLRCGRYRWNLLSNQGLHFPSKKLMSEPIQPNNTVNKETISHVFLYTHGKKKKKEKKGRRANER